MLNDILLTLTSGLPVFLTHTITTIGVWLIATSLYQLITPHREITLVKEGNFAAAISLGALYVSMALPLAICMASSLNVYDILVWGTATFVFQIVAYFAFDLYMKNLSKRISEGEIAIAVYLASIKLSLSIIIASAISG